MAKTITRYADPGVYIQEVTGPGSVSVTSERTLALIGVAPRTRRAIDEQVVRGKIYAEVLTISSSSPYVSAELTNKSDRSRNESTLYMNGNELGLGDWSFNPAALVGAEWAGGDINVSSNKNLTLSLDGIAPITLDLNALLLSLPVPGVPAAATPAKIVEAINTGLVASPLYGAQYSSVASWIAGVTNPIINLTSPNTTPLSSVRIFLSPLTDAAAAVSNNEWLPTASSGVEAPTTIRLVDRAYNAAAEYTLDYQAIDILVDPLVRATSATELQDVISVGTYPGGVDYREGVDFNESPPTLVDWDLLTQAVATSKELSILPVITTGINDKLSIEINERNPLLITLPSNTYKEEGNADAPGVISSGNATSIGASASELNDSGATFQADGVAPDDIVQNTTDGTQANVLSVPGETQIMLDADIFPLGTEAYSIYTPSQLTDAAATFSTNLVAAGDYVLNVTTGVQAEVVSVDSETVLTLDADIFSVGDSYTVSTPQALTDIADAINAALAAAPAYGVMYAFVCSVDSNTLVFEAPSPFANYPTEVGYASNIVFSATTADAFATIFGTQSQPYAVRGEGLRPAFGTSYYVTYDYTRPSTDYTTAHRVYDVDQLWSYTTQCTLGNYLRNALCIAGELAFENGATSLYLIQVNDLTVEGQPTQSQINAAIDVAEEYQLITEVVTLDTSLETAVYQMRHVSNQSSLLEKHYRRGWFGMSRDTSVGDPDTPGTFVNRATKTLQPGNTSAGRGRLVLVAPPNASRVLTLDDGREVIVDLDGSYVAAAVCSVSTALFSPAEVLLGKTVAGFLGDGFGTYLRGERHTLADNGVTVVTYDAGNFELIDPVTTENGGAKVVQFVEPSASPQKDAVTLTVDRLLDSNMKGLVPEDLADFISEIKKWIILGILANIGNGTIAPYRSKNGLTRDIDATTDIQVYQSPTDPRVFYFKYWYNLRYPAKWFYGEYSVDNPFFSPQ